MPGAWLKRALTKRSTRCHLHGLPIRLRLLAGRVHILLRQERGPNLHQLIRSLTRQHVVVLHDLGLPTRCLRGQLEPLQASLIEIQRVVLAFQAPEQSLDRFLLRLGPDDLVLQD